MNENGKFVRLFGTIFFSFITFIVVLILVMLGLKFLFGILDKIPWFSLMFILFIISVPAVLFLSVYTIYFYRTRQHPSSFARYFSYIIFGAVSLCWLYVWIDDLIIFFKYYYNSISHYNSFNLAFLAGNIGLIFLIGILQAFTSKKETTWLDKAIKKESENV